MIQQTPSYRYYLVSALLENADDQQKVLTSLEELLGADDICIMHTNCIFVRAKGKGRNGELIYNTLQAVLERKHMLCVTTIGIRTLLGDHIPVKAAEWRNYENELVTAAALS